MKNLSYHLFLFLGFFACSQQECISQTSNQLKTNSKTYKYLALGDSYTIGESVCKTCRFPEQLKDTLNSSEEVIITVDIIAKSGWTTTDLIQAIDSKKPSEDYDLVTLLIGVNNQYRHKPFSMYETEFTLLLNDAIKFAKGDKSKVIVISIPDYGFTPSRERRNKKQKISIEIDQYNAYAKMISEAKGVLFQDITDITRLGLEDTELVASDDLHPSEKAYKKFVERLFVNAKKAIEN